MGAVPRLAAIFIYPVKACRGVPLDRAQVVERGLEGDRRWMIVDQDDAFVTQRQDPRLALIDVMPGPDGFSLSAPGLSAVQVPWQLEKGPARTVQVWRHTGDAREHAAGSAWISGYLGAPHRLVYMPDSHRREVNPEKAGPGHIVGFADGYPFLLIGQASLDDLNARLTEPVEMRRFRPNLVVEGSPPFAEDGWSRLQIGSLAFRGVKPCDRCTVTTVDPDTGARGPEPLRTLSTYRKQEHQVLFGMNLVHDQRGTIAVGDAVDPLS
jgi:uncharacterized protein YcbX